MQVENVKPPIAHLSCFLLPKEFRITMASPTSPLLSKSFSRGFVDILLTRSERDGREVYLKCHQVFINSPSKRDINLTDISKAKSVDANKCPQNNPWAVSLSAGATRLQHSVRFHFDRRASKLARAFCKVEHA